MQLLDLPAGEHRRRTFHLYSLPRICQNVLRQTYTFRYYLDQYDAHIVKVNVDEIYLHNLWRVFNAIRAHKSGYGSDS